MVVALGHSGVAGVGAKTMEDVLTVVLTSPEPPTRKEVAERLDLSPSTITKAVQALVADGYLEGSADGAGKNTPLIINKTRCYVAGVSIDETGQVLGILTDLGAKDEVARVLASFDANNATPDAVTAAVVEVIATLLADHRSKTRGVGVALGGYIDAREGIVRASWNFSPAWQDVPLARRLCRHPCLEGLEVHLENDANALALYVQWFGAGRDLDNFSVAIVERGVGFGIVANGQLLHGDEGLNGELGHVDVGVEAKCRCGRVGCLEILIRRAAAAKGKAVGAAMREAGEAMGRVVAQMQLTNASSDIVVYGNGVTHSEEFKDAFFGAIASRPFLNPSSRVFTWERLTHDRIALGAASILLRHLKLGR